MDKVHRLRWTFQACLHLQMFETVCVKSNRHNPVTALGAQRHNPRGSSATADESCCTRQGKKNEQSAHCPGFTLWHALHNYQS